MKFRFLSSDKIYEIPTTTSAITQFEFMKMLYTFIFKDKDPTCSFVITNCDEKEVINCETDIPIIKKTYAKLFQQPTKMEMTKKPVKKRRRRWKSRSPERKKIRVRRWRSRSPKRMKWC